jgi:hypothetical protein
MVSTTRATRIVLTIGLTIGAGATCLAQTDAPPIQDRPQKVGPTTQERIAQDRAMERERMGDRTLVKERVVERRREGEIYVGGFGGFVECHRSYQTRVQRQ